MIRLAWLQARIQTMVTVAGVAALAVVLALTGSNLAHLYSTNIAPCVANGDCSPTTLNSFLHNYSGLRNGLDILVLFVPALIGIFWGAPMVARELEAGTFRLAWTQSVTRTRWLAIKLGVTLVITMAVAGLLSLMVTWWAHPFDRVRADAFTYFEQRNIAPIGYAAFGFVLGVAAGVLIRRTLPAMVTVLVVFTAARVAMNHWVRSRLIAPLHLTSALDPDSTGYGRRGSGPASLDPRAPRLPDAWIYSTRIVDNAGHGLTNEVLTSTCPQLSIENAPRALGSATRQQAPPDIQAALRDCVTAVGKQYHTLVTYQPASRYWAFQWYELAIYLGAAAVLAGACVWAIRRR